MTENNVWQNREIKFNILIDKLEDYNCRGLKLSGGELRVARFSCYHDDGSSYADTAFYESIQTVQEAGLLQVPTYAFINGRSLADLSERVWSPDYPQDTLGERLTLNVDKSYKNIPKGEWVVDIQGGGLFTLIPEIMMRVVEDEELVDGAMPIILNDKDLLLGERQVYRWNGKNIEQVQVDYFFTSFEEFLEVSETPEFQTALRDLSAVYAVLRPASEARKNPSGRKIPITKQLKNPDLIIPAGGKRNLNRMLMEPPDEKTGKQVPRFDLKEFGSTHDGYKNFDTGRSIFLRGYGPDFPFIVHFDNNINEEQAAFCGLAPEALEAWRETLQLRRQLSSKVSKLTPEVLVH